MFERNRFVSFEGVLILLILLGSFFPAIMPVKFIGFVVWLLLFSSYYGFGYYCLKCVNVQAFFKGISRREIVGILFVALLSLCFMGLVAQQNKTIYIWDHAEVWQPAVHCSQEIFHQPIQLLHELYSSINHQDYNNFLAMLMTIPLRIFGMEFMPYVLCGWALFALPAMFVLTIGIGIMLKKTGVEVVRHDYIFLAVLLIPALAVPSLDGYMFIAVLFQASIFWLFFLQMDIEKVDCRRLLCLAILSILVIIQARSAAYMVVGYFVGVFVYTVCRGKDDGKLKLYMFTLAKKYLVLAGMGLFILFALFHQLLMHSLFYDFKTAYSAYSAGMGYFERIVQAGRYFGWIILLVLLVSVVTGFYQKRLRMYTGMLLGWLLGSLLLITRVQQMGEQHMYVILLPLAILLVLPFCFLYRNPDETKKREIFCAAFFLLLMINFGNGFWGFAPSGILGRVYYPMVRYDINEFETIVSDLRQLSNEKKDDIYIVSSSALLNSDTFQKVNFPRAAQALPSAGSTADVDLRDGFRTSFLDANFIVLADPVQTHLLPKDQQVIVLLHKLMSEDNSLSRKYELVKTYELYPYRRTGNADEDAGNLIRVKLYRKVKPLTIEDVDLLESKFDEVYSNHPELFRNRFEKYKAEKF